MKEQGDCTVCGTWAIDARCVRPFCLGEGQRKKQIPGGNDRKKATATAKQKQGQGQRKKQIPEGNDRKKGNGKGKRRSRFPGGMTERTAKAKAKARARARKKQIPGGNDRRKATANRRRSLSGGWFGWVLEGWVEVVPGWVVALDEFNFCSRVRRLSSFSRAMALRTYRKYSK